MKHRRLLFNILLLVIQVACVSFIVAAPAPSLTMKAVTPKVTFIQWAGGNPTDCLRIISLAIPANNLYFAKDMRNERHLCGESGEGLLDYGATQGPAQIGLWNGNGWTIAPVTVPRYVYTLALPRITR